MITKKKKLDKRIKFSRYIKENHQLLKAMVCLALLFAFIFIPYLYKWLNPTMLSPLGQTIDTNVVVYATSNEIVKDEAYYKAEPLRYLRYRGEQLGLDEYTITKIITMIKTCENSKLNPEAININTDKYRSLDVGIMQINMYWHRNEVKLVDMLDPVKNIDFGYKMFMSQGFEPWSCAHKLGYVK